MKVIKRALILCFATICFISQAFGQEYRSELLGKTWYAIKIFKGVPGDENKHMDFICEEDCSSSKQMYYFKYAIDASGNVKTFARDNKSPNFTKVEIGSQTVTFSNGNSEENKYTYSIKLLKEDFLIIQDKRQAMYYFISDHQYIPGALVN